MYKVMIVDCHPIVRTGLSKLLKSIPGVELWGTADCATSAVEQAQELRPDMAIVELALPEMKGAEVVSLILKATSGIEILVLANRSSSEMLKEAFRVGAKGYVSKADSVQDIIEGINTIRSHKLFVSSSLTSKYGLGQTAWATRNVGLSKRESEVLKMLACGGASKQIGVSLGISPRTVEAHRSQIMSKLKLNGLSELIRFALRNDIVKLDPQQPGQSVTMRHPNYGKYLL